MYLFSIKTFDLTALRWSVILGVICQLTMVQLGLNDGLEKPHVSTQFSMFMTVFYKETQSRIQSMA